jgi:hypothetical protein
VTYLSRLLQEKKSYFESIKIFNYEMLLVYGKSLGWSPIKMQPLVNIIRHVDKILLDFVSLGLWNHCHELVTQISNNSSNKSSTQGHHPH